MRQCLPTCPVALSADMPRCSYYILRNDMLAYYVNYVKERLSVKQDHDGWEVSSHSQTLNARWDDIHTRTSKQLCTA